MTDALAIPLGVLGCAVLAAPLCQARNALLPRPQEVAYGQGALPLRGLRVRLVSEPAAEDRFTAANLAASLSGLTGTSIAVAGPGRGPAIRLHRTAAPDPLPGPEDRGGPDSREAYSLEVTPGGADIRAKSSAGLFYGTRTLLQLVEGRGGEASFPAVTIRDWPAMPYRGFMMDMSHGALPTEDEIKRQIDFLSGWKANQYYFYSEASIEVPGYDLVNPGARYTAEQIRRIVAYGRERHVDIVPCLELFSHIHDVLRVERYADLSPLRYGGEFKVRDDRARKLIEDWVTHLAALFPSPWMHIGFDEPWALQRWGTASAGEPDSGKLFLEHLQFVGGLVRREGKRVVIWVDQESGSRIFKLDANLKSKLPPGTVVVPWDYDPKPDYSPQIAPFTSAGLPVVVAPGISNWNEIVPDFTRTFDNIDGFLQAAKKQGGVGILNAGWTDSAQVLFRMALPAMAYGAVASWQTPPVERARFFDEYSALVYPPEIAADCGAALDALARAETLYWQALGGRTMHRFWDDALSPARLRRSAAHEQELRDARLAAETAQERLQRAIRLQPGAPSLRSLLVGARMLDYLGMKHLFALQMSNFFAEAEKDPKPQTVLVLLEMYTRAQNHGLISDLLDGIAELKEQFRGAWLDEYTEYRLPSAMGRWDAEFEYWRRLQARVSAALDGRKEGDPVPPLDSLR